MVVVVGGANVDIKVQTFAPAVAGTSNPGHSSRSLGGVGRNIAENLARLGVQTKLISAVGDDALGQWLIADTYVAGVNVDGVLRVPNTMTGTYTAVLDDTGELVIAVAAMGVMDALTPDGLTGQRELLRGAAWIVADGNLPEPTLKRLLALGAELSVPVVFEPVSVPKAVRLLPALEAGQGPHTITPNVAELAALVGHDVSAGAESLRTAALALHSKGIQVVWVRRGEQGSLLSTPGEFWELPALPARVVDVTGAGDSMLAAFLAALLAGATLPHAAWQAHAAAALTIESALTVVPGLSLEKLRARVEESRSRGAMSYGP